MRRLKPSESQIQKSIVDYLEAMIPNIFLFAVPNAAKRKKGGRAGNAVPGLRPGVPDLCFIWGIRTFFLEVKRPGEKLSDAQRGVHCEMLRLQIKVATVESIDDVRAALRAWNVPTRESEETGHG
jgi:hypothetical protein